MSYTLPIAFSVLIMMTSSLFAQGLIQTDLDPIKHNPATLTIISVDGTEVSYTPAQIEEFTTYTLTTTTPWRETPVKFDGALLSDILAANGLETVNAIIVTAENDYQTSFQHELLETVPILVATRANDKPHSRRDRGPIQFVIEADVFKTSPLTSESNFVWMAARIEAAN